MAKSKFALAALIATAAGFVAGILTAPKSGKETRADIKEQAVKAKNTATLEVEMAKEIATEKVKEVKGRAEKAIEDAKKDLAQKSKSTKK